jgi:hypothetical protein
LPKPPGTGLGTCEILHGLKGQALKCEVDSDLKTIKLTGYDTYDPSTDTAIVLRLSAKTNNVTAQAVAADIAIVVYSNAAGTVKLEELPSGVAVYQVDVK